MVKFYTYLEIYLDDLHKKVTLGDFEKHFKKPHQTVKAHLKEFVDKKILLIEKKTRFTFYSLNLNNPLIREYLSMCEKERLFYFLDQNPLFKRFYETISNNLKNNKILIFGSAVSKKGFSDIDLLIIPNDKQIRKIINDFMRTYNVKLHIVQTDEKNLTEPFLIELKKHHIIFNEYEYFIKVLYKNELRLV